MRCDIFLKFLSGFVAFREVFLQKRKGFFFDIKFNEYKTYCLLKIHMNM